MADTTARPAPKSPPSECPKCGRSTAANFTRAKRAGLHCHADDSEKWARSCGIVLCECGTGYAAGGFASETEMRTVR